MRFLRTEYLDIENHKLRELILKKIRFKRTIKFVNLNGIVNTCLYVDILNKELELMGYGDDYIAYYKKRRLFNLYSVKIKPINQPYKNRIIEKADKKWKKTIRDGQDIISRSTSGQQVIVKKCDDYKLAIWYKSVLSLSPVFQDYALTLYKHISSFAPPLYKITIDCDINININM